jgi:hypothetical protein
MRRRASLVLLACQGNIWICGALHVCLLDRPKQLEATDPNVFPPLRLRLGAPLKFF